MEDERYDEKLFTIAGDIISEYHESKRLYEEAEKKAEEAMNIARRLRNEAEAALVNMIQKEEDKNIAIENAVISFKYSSKSHQDENTDHKLIPPEQQSWNPNMHD